MKVPIFKAKDKDSNSWVEGTYFAYPTTTFCFAEDYQDGVPVVPMILFWAMTDWGLPNKPMFCTIDPDTLEQTGWIDTDTRLFKPGKWMVSDQEIIRCKDCKHHHIFQCMNEQWYVDGEHSYPTVEDDDFCSYAERKFNG